MARPRPSDIRSVLFDLDGVLVDSERAWFETLCLTAERFGAPTISWERFSPTFGQGIVADQRTFFPTASIDEVGGAYDELYPGAAARAELLEGAITLLEALRAREIRTALVTNAPRRAAEAVLAAKGLASLLDAAVTSTDGPEKPDPGLVHLALSKIGGSAARAVYVGDSATDRGAANAAGVFFIGRGIDGDVRVETLGELGRWLDAG
ncbi:MAG: HAD family hydrolase [Deltaproteobacteria bacterium]|nr:HAD family hydrolase [Deltaproteobacteria bacterium]